VFAPFWALSPSTAGELLRFVILDDKKPVHFAALPFVRPEHFSADPNLILRLLVEPSFAVRRASIPLVADCAGVHAVYMTPLIILFLDAFFITGVFAPAAHRALLFVLLVARRADNVLYPIVSYILRECSHEITHIRTKSRMESTKHS
jgi:hypothetical protein